jgi:hypothetical protein
MEAACTSETSATTPIFTQHKGPRTESTSILFTEQDLRFSTGGYEMFCNLGYNAVSSTDVSEEHVASTFRVQKSKIAA